MNAGIQGYVCFEGWHLLKAGTLAEVALAAKAAQERQPSSPVLLFDNQTGRSIDIDLRGTDAQIIERFASADDNAGQGDTPALPKGRGRPKLGVVPREVTLLPRHWEWLSAQPGGASVAIRKLVEQARREQADQDVVRDVQGRTYQFMSAIGGDLAGFEAASRALFAGDNAAFALAITDWPQDVHDHILRLSGSLT